MAAPTFRVCEHPDKSKFEAQNKKSAGCLPADFF
jgi:hypothetical protein